MSKFTNMKLRYKIGAGIATGATVLGMGVAYAQWTASGTGVGTAKAGSAQGVTAATATYSVTTGLLYPGGAGDLLVTLSNPNPYPVTVTQIAQDTSAGKFVSSDKPAGTNNATACTDDPASTPSHPTGVSFSQQTTSISLAAHGNSGDHATVTLSGSVSMSGSSDNNCQGATFTIPVTTSAISAA